MGYETGILFGILSMLGFGLSNAISQKLVRKAGEINAMVYQTLVTVIILFPVFFLYPLDFSFSLYYAGIALIVSLIGVIPFFAFYKALNIGKIGVVVPVSNSASLLTVALSMIFLNEVLTSVQMLAISAIILGVILISFRPSDLKKRNVAAGVPYALAASFFWGVYYFLLKFPIAVLGALFTAALTQLGILFFTALYGLKSGRLTAVSGASIKYIVITGIALTVAVTAFNIGISTASTSIVMPLAFSGPLVSTVYARIFYKERLEPLQYLALLMIVGGIVLLSTQA